MDRPTENPDLIDLLGLVADGLASILGPRCEVAVHDLQKPGCPIVKIINSHITGRGVGDCLASEELDILKLEADRDNAVISRSFRTADGKLNCGSICFRAKNGGQSFLLCVNLGDVTGVSEEISAFEALQEDFPIHGAVCKVIGKLGKSLLLLKKEDRLKVIAELDENGFLQSRDSIIALARVLGVSEMLININLEKVRSGKINLG